ncbi:MAG TPA: hypothetical protein VNV86_08800 [Candidatus Acidoferrum sp.]|jgi:hypothetical protein|nr:hypothetical protein [Candidatus Acidoferrum sp.]
MERNYMESRYIHRQLTTALVLSASFIGPLVAQTKTEALTVQDPRPLSALAAEIEKRTGVPINYEDVRYENAADVRDVTDSIMSPEQKAQALPGVRVIVPNGGGLTTSISVNSTGSFPDVASASAALAGALNAYHTSPAFRARFTVSTGDGVLYIQPTQMRDATGQIKAVTPVLAAPITLERQTRSGLETLDILAKQLSKTSGYRVEVGTVPLRAMIASQVTIGSDNESAATVVTRLLVAVAAASGGGAGGPALSYAMLFDPRQAFYVINVHPVPNPNPASSLRTLPISKPASVDGVYFKQPPAK